MRKRPMTRKAIAAEKFGMPKPGRRAVSVMPKMTRPATRVKAAVPKKAVASARKMIALRRRAK